MGLCFARSDQTQKECSCVIHTTTRQGPDLTSEVLCLASMSIPLPFARAPWSSSGRTTSSLHVKGLVNISSLNTEAAAAAAAAMAAATIRS